MANSEHDLDDFTPASEFKVLYCDYTISANAGLISAE